MYFHEYQEQAESTATYPEAYRIVYPTLGLAGEAGELANKVKKVIRDDGNELSPEKRDAILAEVGDVLWYCSAICSDLDASLEAIAEENIAKLQSRAARNVLAGSGDNR
jgi:NTP pyrophosphatase (non-canonical NTP hydrolase)